MVPKVTKSIKMAQNGARAKKIAPRIGKDAKKSQEIKKMDPPGRPKSVKIEKKVISKIDDFFDPLLEPTLPHFRLPQAPQKQPK